VIRKAAGALTRWTAQMMLVVPVPDLQEGPKQDLQVIETLEGGNADNTRGSAVVLLGGDREEEEEERDVGRCKVRVTC
jgi:hypothetical protein